MTSPQTTSDVLIATLVECGVDTCFANPGTTEVFIVSALDRCASMSTVLCLHEAVATGACDGYARVAGRPALSLLHLGPGLGNGLCNLHNAKRARSPVVVLVGDMATWHASADAPLQQDIPALARTVAARVERVGSCSEAAPAARRAMAAATAADTPNEGGRVSALILPHDLSWSPADPVAARPPQQHPQPGDDSSSVVPAAAAAGSEDVTSFTRACAAALKACPPGKAAIYCGGRALLAEGGVLAAAGRVAAAAHAALLCEPMYARLDRGAGLPCPTRLPYFPQEAAAELAKYELLMLLDASRPVAMFGYKDGPSQLVKLPDDAVWEFDDPTHLPHVVAVLEQELGANSIVPGVNCRGLFPSAGRPPLPSPSGALTPAALCTVVAALQPEGMVLVDESLTSGGSYYHASKGCPPFTHLCLTGGAIGCGPPMALGAAIAAPGRRVVNLQADGSGMYTLQALWTQARHACDVLTIICDNRTYAILQVENVRQRVPPATRGEVKALLSLDSPGIDWVALAAGLGVAGGAARTVGEAAELMRRWLGNPGPFLIQAVLAA